MAQPNATGAHGNGRIEDLGCRDRGQADQKMLLRGTEEIKAHLLGQDDLVHDLPVAPMMGGSFRRFTFRQKAKSHGRTLLLEAISPGGGSVSTFG